MAESTPPPKKAKRLCHFDSNWVKEFQGIGRSSKGNYAVVCIAIPFQQTTNIQVTHMSDAF